MNYSDYSNKNIQKIYNKPISRNPKKKLNFKFEKYAYQKLQKKYKNTPLDYQMNIINDIIYNEKTHIVTIFKDYLIYDDNNEFFKRFYKSYESILRLPKYFEYYHSYSKIYPNYTSIPECKYIYKNIQKKQRMIDLQEEFEKEKLNNNSLYISNEELENIFSTDIIDSILNVTNKEDIELLFNINRDNNIIEEQKFYEKINDLIDTIDKLENINNNAQTNINIDSISSYKNKIYQRNLNEKFTIKSSSNINNNILKRYISNSVTNLYRNNSPHFTKISSKWNNSSNKILNIYSKKNNLKNHHTNNESFNPSTERSLIEKLEYNLLKLTKKNLMFSKRNFNLSNKNKSSSRREYSTFSKHNISTYSKTKNSSSINLNNYTYHKSSNSNNNISQSVRFGKNNINISSNENYIKTPLTAKNIMRKSISNPKNNINISNTNISLRQNNSKNNSLNQQIHINKVMLNKDFINNRKFMNKNSIYVIKKNPNITFHNSKSEFNILKLTKNLNVIQNPKRKNNSYPKNKKFALGENNNSDQHNMINEKIKKRNISFLINSNSDNNLMTTRNIEKKNLNILKNNLKSKIGKKELNNNFLSDNKSVKNYNEKIKSNLRNIISRNYNFEKHNEYTLNKNSKNELIKTKLNFVEKFKKLENNKTNIKNLSKIYNNLNIPKSKSKDMKK